MRQLTGLDAAFLALDSSTAYGHVGSVSVLEQPESGESLTLDRLTDLVASRLHLIPPFRHRLVEVPFGLDQPYWIDDSEFDIEFHVRELALSAPGDDRQLAVQSARLHARPLDRRRPLWETYLISNVPGPAADLYMCGAQLDAVYPLSAIADGQGLNLTVLGSNGKLNFGALADRDLVPDVDVIIDALKDELAALTDAVAAG
ncbi:wax ester/triacylglycerol synthase domain-containing protein [Mycobacterium pseudokansasii]|uniref:wax ester/triacylglycerol synthase domain-containing protein n=1 Tax=Mycobacterium pseudokansasii TaxID=2341080 RepID=UPI000F0F1DF1|nr:wax ester/triacylglycerol synthase domain-containing protein [Mycobacterium pseudokansasii]VAZ96681.1 putative diacylglycerol O-acyltransferase tgs3 [Mycobacterium pseudokansasii]VAZ98112.1 putative diacylglycerol O-acyltransferase tgs3 [Mycobacterium pseudokansasii]